MDLIINSVKYGKIVFLIDDDDCKKVLKYKWSLHKCKNGFYAKTHIIKNNKNCKLLLHRYLTDCNDGLIVDHANRNTLDNRKLNLRICTHADNMHNSSSKVGSLSEYKGVSFFNKTHKWRSRIKIKDREISLGYFDTEIDAALVYNGASRYLHGEYACLNII